MKFEIVARLLAAVLVGMAAFAPDADAQTATRPRWSQDDANSRIVELEQLGEAVAENDYLVADELRGLGEEIKSVRASARTFESQVQALASAETAKSGFVAFLGKLSKVDCSQADQRQEMEKLGKEEISAIEDVSDSVAGDYSWFLDDEMFSSEDACNEAKAKPFSETHDELKKQTEAMLAAAATKTKSIGEQADTAKRLLASLEKRRSAVLRKLQSPQQLLTQNLVGLIMTIAGAGVASMLALLAFRADIQREWVISGQVIQFVTVLILLSVSLALGLAGILKEQSLGTLLGGLAGYVLAQGVGQAARQGARRGTEASNSNKDSQNSKKE